MTNKTKTVIGVVGGVIVLGSVGAAIKGNDDKGTSSSPISSIVSDISSAPSTTKEEKSTVKIAAANIVQDGDNTILMIDYEFYNGEDEVEAFMYNFSDKAYQHGIECGTAYGHLDGQSSKILPGTTFTVKAGYILSDLSNAEIKVTNLFGDDTFIIGTIEFKTVTPENEPAYISLVWHNGVTSPPENAQNKPTSVKIADYKLGKDYRDRDILIVTYEFYNGENKEKGFAYTFTDNAYQHGVELNDTVVGCDEVDAQMQLSAIKPGVTHNVVVGYHITDRSDVTIQLTEWIGDKIVLNETLKIDDL